MEETEDDIFSDSLEAAVKVINVNLKVQDVKKSLLESCKINKPYNKQNSLSK